MSMDPESTVEPAVSPESPGLDGPGFGRRDAIKYGSMGAGLILATPTILTLGATPAAASGQVSPQTATVSNTAGLTSLTTTQLQQPIGILLATVTVFLSNITFNTPDGWTALDAATTTSGSGAARISSVTYYRYYATAQADQAYTFTWSPTTTAAGASCVINKFPTATTVLGASTPVLSTTGTSRTCTAVTPASNASGSASVVVCLGYARVSSVPIPNAPTDTINAPKLYVEAGIARVANNGSQHWTLFPATDASTGTITLTGMTDGRASVMRAIALV
jgi:hypothetical protein